MLQVLFVVYIILLIKFFLHTFVLCLDLLAKHMHLQYYYYLFLQMYLNIIIHSSYPLIMIIFAVYIYNCVPSV